MRDKEAVLAALKAAFHDVPYPGDAALTPHECLECASIRRQLKAHKDWIKHLHDPFEVMGKHLSVMTSLVSVEGQHYFMPILMAAIVVDLRRSDVLADQLPGIFNPGREPLVQALKQRELWEWSRDRAERLLKMMTSRQREAVLQAMLTLPIPENDGEIFPSAKAALENLEAGRLIRCA